MRNFRGEKERTTEFNADVTTISGANGLGKSRHFDAFLWLLFGKDTEDRKDFNIKSLVDGKTQDKVDTEVSAELGLNNGKTVNLRRVYKEKWVKPRGQAVERFDGHETEYFWNDVPLKQSEYIARVNDIVNDTVFKMITNPMFFASMKWQEQREQLFQLAGTIADDEIAQQNPDYSALLDKISGKSLAEFKREISARKKKLRDELETIGPRIDQTQKLMPETADFDKITAEISELEKQIEQADIEIADRKKADEQTARERRDLMNEILELENKQTKIVSEANKQAQETVNAENAQYRKLQQIVDVLQRDIVKIDSEIEQCNAEISTIQKKIANKQTEIDNLRNQWADENAKEFSGDLSCSVCMQPLPADSVDALKGLFETNKSNKLDSINSIGGSLKSEIEQLEQSFKNDEKRIDELQIKRSQKMADIAITNENLEKTTLKEVAEIDFSKLPKFMEIETKKEGLNKKYEKLQNQPEVGVSDLITKKREISTQVEPLRTTLRNRDLIAKYTAEIAELGKKGKELAQQIADAEREEHTIGNSIKAKIEECERRINGLFEIVTFRLFEYTIDGNEIEVCVPLVNGVPFGAVNTAGQINAGLDIINALVKHYGISAPIWIDNRESVNSIIDTKSQIINLVVTTEPTLTIS